MELASEELLTIISLVSKKCELEKKLKKTIKCLLRKCFSCMGMSNIEAELHNINQEITTITKPKIIKPIMRSTSF